VGGVVQGTKKGGTDERPKTIRTLTLVPLTKKGGSTRVRPVKLETTTKKKKAITHGKHEKGKKKKKQDSGNHQKNDHGRNRIANRQGG